MNEIDSSDLEDNNKPYDWKSGSPEDVLWMIIYEFRTPLTLIKGYTEMLSNETVKEQHPKAIEAIKNNIVHIMKMNDDIAEYLVEFKKRTQNK